MIRDVFLRVRREKRGKEERLGDCVDEGGWVLSVRDGSWRCGTADLWSLVFDGDMML